MLHISRGPRCIYGTPPLVRWTGITADARARLRLSVEGGPGPRLDSSHDPRIWRTADHRAGDPGDHRPAPVHHPTLTVLLGCMAVMIGVMLVIYFGMDD